jgi:hypothetical protein
VPSNDTRPVIEDVWALAADAATTTAANAASAIVEHAPILTSRRSREP